MVGGEAGQSPVIRPQSVNEPVLLGCDLHKSFSVLVHFLKIPLGETGRLAGAELGSSLPQVD